MDTEGNGLDCESVQSRDEGTAVGGKLWGTLGAPQEHELRAPSPKRIKSPGMGKSLTEGGALKVTTAAQILRSNVICPVIRGHDVHLV